MSVLKVLFSREFPGAFFIDIEIQTDFFLLPWKHIFGQFELICISRTEGGRNYRKDN